VTTPVINVSGLHKAYKTVHAVDDVSFTVQRGEVFALLGPNGAGKTTTIEILEGFMSRDRGSVQVLGFDPGNVRHQQLFRTRIGIVLQELAVEPYFTVRQVLERNAGFYPSSRPVAEVIELIGLADKGDARVKTLSGGQQRRLDVGLGIIGRPELLFLDEPTSGLDPAGRHATWDAIRTLASEGVTVLLTSHYMDEIEALAQRVVVLSGGRIVAAGPPASLGGRDHGQVTVRFTLPVGLAPENLPIPVARVNGTTAEIRTDDELGVIARLTRWARDADVAIVGLTVTRASLEDVYLALTNSADTGGVVKRK